MQRQPSTGAAAALRRPSKSEAPTSPEREGRRSRSRPVTAKTAALLRELEDKTTEDDLESGFLIKKQLQLEETRVGLCKRLEVLDVQLAAQGPSRGREEAEKIKQDLELFKELGARVDETPLDDEIRALIDILRRKLELKTTASIKHDVELHCRELEALLASDVTRDPSVVLQEDKETALQLLSRTMLLFSEAEQLKVEAAHLDSPAFLEKYREFEQSVTDLNRKATALNERRHTYIPDVAAIRAILNRVEAAEREAAAIRQLAQVFSSSSEALWSPRQQGNMDQIVDHLSGSNFWRLFGQGPVGPGSRASDSVPAAQFRSLQTRHKLLQREFDLFRERQSRVCANCVLWESKVSQLRRKVHILQSRLTEVADEAGLGGGALAAHETSLFSAGPSRASSRPQTRASRVSRRTSSPPPFPPPAASAAASAAPQPPLWVPSSAKPAPLPLPPPAAPLGAASGAAPAGKSPGKRRAVSAVPGDRGRSVAASALIAVAAGGALARRARTAVGSKRAQPFSAQKSGQASDSDVMEVLESDTDGLAVEHMAHLHSPPPDLPPADGGDHDHLAVLHQRPPVGHAAAAPAAQRARGSAAAPSISVEPPTPPIKPASGTLMPLAAGGSAGAAATGAGAGAAEAGAGGGAAMSMPPGLRGKSAPSPRDEAAPAVQIASISGHTSTIRSLALSPADGGVVATWCADAVRVWDIDARRVVRTFPGHGGQLGEARFHPAGKLLVSCGEDNFVKFWNVTPAPQLPDMVHELKLENAPACVSFSPSGGRLAVGSYKVLHFVDVETGTPIATMPAHSMCVYSCDYHPHENIVCSAGDDKLVKVWDLNSGKCVSTIASHASWVWRTRFGLDGSLLATASQDHAAKVFDWRANRLLHQMRHRETVFSVAMSSEFMFTAGQDRCARIWRLRDGAVLGSMPGHLGTVYDVGYSSTRKLVLTGGADKILRLWRFPMDDAPPHALEARPAVPM